MDYTIKQIADWRHHRARIDPDGYLNHQPGHQALHILKALGPIAALGEHRDHNEPDTPIEPKRIADAIIHTIWLAESLGYHTWELVATRINEFEDGFDPNKTPTTTDPDLRP